MLILSLILLFSPVSWSLGPDGKWVFGVDAAHAGRLQAYEKAMRDRSRLLGEAARDGRAADPDWLGALEAAMAERGMAIAAARAALVRRLNPACARSSASLSIRTPAALGWDATLWSVP